MSQPNGRRPRLARAKVGVFEAADLSGFCSGGSSGKGTLLLGLKAEADILLDPFLYVEDFDRVQCGQQSN